MTACLVQYRTECNYKSGARSAAGSAGPKVAALACSSSQSAASPAIPRASGFGGFFSRLKSLSDWKLVMLDAAGSLLGRLFNRPKLETDKKVASEAVERTPARRAGKNGEETEHVPTEVAQDLKVAEIPREQRCAEENPVQGKADRQSDNPQEETVNMIFDNTSDDSLAAFMMIHLVRNELVDAPPWEFA